jgi:hypothetical protein
LYHNNQSMRIFLATLILLLPAFNAFSQIGGKRTYGFLDLTNSARVASLGGKNISIRDNDLNLVFHNPALLSPDMDKHMVLNYVNYFAGIHYGYVSYAIDHPKIGPISGGLHFVNYGLFDGTDPGGQSTGTFWASEYSLNLTWAHQIDSTLTLGSSFKQIFSFLESYSSYGMAFDFGMNYYYQPGKLSASFVIKNLGIQLTPYYKGGPRDAIPFEIMAGATKKLEHAPFRFSVILHHLENYNLHTERTATSFDSELNSSTMSGIEKIGAEFLSHIITGVEFIPTENFFFNIGYNYLRRQELKIEERVSTVGFSWGFGLKVKKFHISYGRATYHVAGASNHFSISTNLSAFQNF